MIPNTSKKPKSVDFLHQLFDICSCKCVSRLTCTCVKENKVNPREWDFLADQRGDREMVIGNIDKDISKKWQVAQNRADAVESQILKEDKRCEDLLNARKKQMESFFEYEMDANENLLGNKSDEEFTLGLVDVYGDCQESTQNRLDISYFIAEVDRYQIPDRAAAALATGLLRDIGKITETDTSLVVDKYKIRRARKIRQEKQTVMRFNDTYGNINCLGFDGKKDKNTKILMLTERLQQSRILLLRSILFLSMNRRENTLTTYLLNLEKGLAET